MNPKTLKALRQSARKWQSIYENRGVDKQRDNCALCKRFGSDCELLDEKCPIFKHTGYRDCFNSPYSIFRDHATLVVTNSKIKMYYYLAETPPAKAAALAMYELLCKLAAKK